MESKDSGLVSAARYDPDESVRYSLVIPLYNERENILPLYKGLRESLEGLHCAFECVFVDDGSTDDSLSLLRELALEDGRVTVVAMHHNSGKSSALCAGFNVALGRFIITMDGDLQHSAADIPKFTEKLEQGYDIVCGWRIRHTEGSWLQKVFTSCANWISARISGTAIHDFGGGFKAYKRELVAQLSIYGELQRLIPVMALRKGGRVCEVPITALPREHGVSKYGVRRKLPFLFDLITVRFLLDYLSRPLHFFGSAGMFSFLAGGFVGVWLIISKLFFGAHVMQQHGPLLIFGAVLIVSGVQLIALGLLAELQVRHYHEQRDRSAAYSVEGALHTSHKNHEFLRR
ncbi:MAG: glycosyltransferase family 2 protein [Acidobacteriota bacterium]|nr:glycosyltransferase family 2 protein [Acidobacteriota bacterium]